MSISPKWKSIYQERRQRIFNNYLITKNMGLTADHFNITRQRVQQIVTMFGYKKPAKYKPSKEEIKAGNLANQKRIFWNRVDVKSDDECWEWQGARLRNGYGHCNIHYEWYPHRVAWVLTIGDIPIGMNVLSICNNHLCCNPKHYYLGTHKDTCAKRYRKPPIKSLIHP